MKTKIAIIFGGRTTEHKVSLLSAYNVNASFEKEKYEISLIGITKTGVWNHYPDIESAILNPKDTHNIELIPTSNHCTIVRNEDGTYLISLSGKFEPKLIEVVFPAMHGTYGEDGSIQGFLRMVRVPFIGPSVLGSSIGMDKIISKRLLRDAGIKTAEFIVLSQSDIRQPSFEEVKEKLGAPFFIKPSRSGSSVGVSKVSKEEHYQEKLNEAFKYDTNILIEAGIVGRELENCVIGNKRVNIRSSLPGEVKMSNKYDFYSFDAKYDTNSGCYLDMPAKLTIEQLILIRDAAIRTYMVLGCEVLTRVDLFLCANDEIYINEVNTVPGCTDKSMFPISWAASGIPFSEILDVLVRLAIDRFNAEEDLNINV